MALAHCHLPHVKRPCGGRAARGRVGCSSGRDLWRLRAKQSCQQSPDSAAGLLPWEMLVHSQTPSPCHLEDGTGRRWDIFRFRAELHGTMGAVWVPGKSLLFEPWVWILGKVPLPTSHLKLLVCWKHRTASSGQTQPIQAWTSTLDRYFIKINNIFVLGNID